MVFGLFFENTGKVRGLKKNFYTMVNLRRYHGFQKDRKKTRPGKILTGENPDRGKNPNRRKYRGQNPHRGKDRGEILTGGKPFSVVILVSSVLLKTMDTTYM